MTMSAFWAPGPVFAQGAGLDGTGTALFKAVTMRGGLFLSGGAGLTGIVLFAATCMIRRDSALPAEPAAFVAVPIKPPHLSAVLDPRGSPASAPLAGGGGEPAGRSSDREDP